MHLFNCRVTNSLNCRKFLLILKRFKTKLQQEEESSSCTKALKYFDDFYKAVFGERWPSVRLALLTKSKYLAVINNLGDTDKTESYFLKQGAFNLREFLEVQKTFVTNSSENEEETVKNTDLENIIQQQLLQEEEKESQILHPEGVDFKAKVDYYNQLNNNSEKTNESSYKPEDSKTSLESDLKISQIDRNRLIMPDSVADSTLLHEFIPATQLKGTEGFIPESDYYKYYKVKSTSPFSFEEEHEIDFPHNLLVYTFDRGEILDFPEPTKSCNGVYDYLKIDGSELLAALALDVKPNDAVLDMCSMSGNISYCVFQTLRSRMLVCAEDKGTTTDLFNKYLYDNENLWPGMLFITSSSINEEEYDCLFDKVLVDVPSTFDKTALFETKNNMFHNQNLKNRLRLPDTQCSLLLKGMKLVKPGGTVVYTTSTLSPVQNDGVVNEALRNIWENNKIKFTVKKLSPALKHMNTFFNFGDYLNLKYGTLVVPFVPVNFGPRYICKIVRNNDAVEECEVD